MIKKELIPFIATHPGEILKDELSARGISQKEFAIDIDMQPTMLNEILKGKRVITSDIAILLEKALDIDANIWMKLQSTYNIDLSRINDRNQKKIECIEIWKIIKEYVPVNIFSKIGVISNLLNNNINQIWKIYEVNSLDSLIHNFSIHKSEEYYKKSDALINHQVNIFGWSKYAKYLAKQIEVNKFSKTCKSDLIDELKNLYFSNKDVISRTKIILEKYGIKFIILEKFKQAPIDGYSFLSNDNPAIVLTLRKKSLDNFAFTIMHELGHVFLHLDKQNITDFLDVESSLKLNNHEIEANNFAKTAFIPIHIWDEFIKSHNTFKYGVTDLAIKSFSKKHRINPAIILGRYCFESKQYKIKIDIDTTLK